jgi:glycosyltransferase involved in cell wall biosynthesis
MKLSVVVPAFNEEKLLGTTLACIREVTKETDVELVVCDNNSTDRTAEIARQAGAKVVFEPVNQISRARNTGAGAASGDWLVFVDADSFPDAALFAGVLDAIRSGNYVGGGATVRFDDADFLSHGAVSVWNAISRTLRWAAGSFIFCRADAFREIGGFSTELYASEEIDFSRRLKRHGRFTILHRHPLRTSGRKVRLYSKREYFRLLLRIAFSGGRALRSRDALFAWYDGRR